MGVNQSVEDPVQGLSELQRRLWEGWLQSMKTVQPPGEPGLSEWHRQYQQSLEVWEKAVQEALDAQCDWGDRCSEQLEGAQLPGPMQGVAKQNLQLMKAWAETRRKMWHAWFESLKHMDPSQLVRQMEGGLGQPQAWQAAGEQTGGTAASGKGNGSGATVAAGEAAQTAPAASGSSSGSRSTARSKKASS